MRNCCVFAVLTAQGLGFVGDNAIVRSTGIATSQEGDEVITGSYKVLRTLKPGTSVKIDNSAPKK